MVIGIILTAGPVIGLFGTVIGMIKAFSTLGGPGIADPRALSDSISVTLFSTTLGLCAFPIGLALTITCSVLLVRAARNARFPIPGLPPGPQVPPNGGSTLTRAEPLAGDDSPRREV